MAEVDEDKQQQAKYTTEIPKKKDSLTLMREWPLLKKVSLGAVLLLSLGVFALLIIQARTADYQLLYANLQEKDAASVVSWLKGQRIGYQLKNGGKNIWIPAGMLYETRLELASSGLPSGGGIGFEIFDKQSFALTDFVQKVNYTRALQGELARTITSLDPVVSTRVHLALPEKRLFKNQQKDATASIIITLKEDTTLDQGQVQGIIHLVSGSVEGLKQEFVTVINSHGKILQGTAKKDDEQRFSVDMLVFQREIETRMESRAQDLLDKTMGYGQAMVRITAKLDFAKFEKTEELFDADDPVIRSEQIQSESNGSSLAGGIPGVESNLQGNSGGQGGSGPTSSKNSRTINYEISKTVSKTVNPLGTIQSLSVSVLLADRVTPGEDPDSPPNITPRTEKELQKVKTMIASALGLDSKRGDIINVASMVFMVDSEDTLIAGGMPENLLYEYLPLAKYGLVTVGLLFFYLFLVRPIIKTLRTDVTGHNQAVEELEQAVKDMETAKAEAELEALEAQEELTPDSVISLRNEVMQNHVPTAYIIKNWINEG
jgi:flagellar M-ring protein FliF